MSANVTGFSKDLGPMPNMRLPIAFSIDGVVGTASESITDLLDLERVGCSFQVPQSNDAGEAFGSYMQKLVNTSYHSQPDGMFRQAYFEFKTLILDARGGKGKRSPAKNISFSPPSSLFGGRPMIGGTSACGGAFISVQQSGDRSWITVPLDKRVKEYLMQELHLDKEWRADTASEKELVYYMINSVCTCATWVPRTIGGAYWLVVGSAGGKFTVFQVRCSHIKPVSIALDPVYLKNYIAGEINQSVSIHSAFNLPQISRVDDLDCAVDMERERLYFGAATSTGAIWVIGYFLQFFGHTSGKEPLTRENAARNHTFYYDSDKQYPSAFVKILPSALAPSPCAFVIYSRGTRLAVSAFQLTGGFEFWYSPPWYVECGDFPVSACVCAATESVLVSLSKGSIVHVNIMMGEDNKARAGEPRTVWNADSDPAVRGGSGVRMAAPHGLALSQDGAICSFAIARVVDKQSSPGATLRFVPTAGEEAALQRGRELAVGGSGKGRPSFWAEDHLGLVALLKMVAKGTTRDRLATTVRRYMETDRNVLDELRDNPVSRGALQAARFSTACAVALGIDASEVQARVRRGTRNRLHMCLKGVIGINAGSYEGANDLVRCVLNELSVYKDHKYDSACDLCDSTFSSSSSKVTCDGAPPPHHAARCELTAVPVQRAVLVWECRLCRAMVGEPELACLLDWESAQGSVRKALHDMGLLEDVTPDMFAVKRALPNSTATEEEKYSVPTALRCPQCNLLMTRILFGGLTYHRRGFGLTSESRTS